MLRLQISTGYNMRFGHTYTVVNNLLSKWEYIEVFISFCLVGFVPMFVSCLSVLVLRQCFLLILPGPKLDI